MAACRQSSRVAAAALLAMVALAAPTIAGAAAEEFDALARKLTAAPEDLRGGNELRRLCRERKWLDRCIEFFDTLAKQHPTSRAAHYHAALAYVDNLPGNSLLVQARLSTRSMEHASAVLEHHPQDWLSLYIRGLNNLYWPKWYRRTDNAIADLTRCVELSEALPAAQRRDYMTLAHVALGDAYVKAEKADQAREVWQRGQSIGSSALLAQRLAIEPGKLAQAIEDIRSREVPVDTDLDFYLADYPGRT